MLDSDQLFLLYERLKLSESARTIVDHIRSSEPSRRVASRVGNVIGVYPSQQMKVGIQYESRTVERPFLVQLEYDPAVKEFYEQPPAIPISYIARNGRKVGIKHTPDVFVIYEDRIEWQEFKPASAMAELAEKMPNRYVQNDDGTWVCPPGQEYASLFGFNYRVRTDDEINWVFQKNTEFLVPYIRHDLEVDSKTASEISDIVSDTFGITLTELLGRGISPDDVFRLLARRKVHFNIHNELLTEPDRVRLFASEADVLAYDAVPTTENPSPLPQTVLKLEPGSVVTLNENVYRVVNQGPDKTLLRGESDQYEDVPNDSIPSLIHSGVLHVVTDATDHTKLSEANELLELASPEAKEEANRRLQIITPYINGEGGEMPPPNRTVQRWMSMFRAAQEMHGYGYVGLIPQKSKRGNRGQRLDPAVVAEMDRVIEELYESVKRKNIRTVYGQFLLICEQKGLVPPSENTFRNRIRKRSVYEQRKKREGRKAAYSDKAFHIDTTPKLDRHGVRPFGVCHVDHTQLDVELVDTMTGQNLGRPWATSLVDAYSRRFLAIYLTFDPPSYRSCMAVLRDCVRLHERLPTQLVVDGGKEFHSVYFDTLLSRFWVEKVVRPAGQARHGSIVERAFNTMNEQIIHNLAGNTQATRNVRQMTKEVDPKRLAVWTLPELYQWVRRYVFEVYDTMRHDSLNCSPRECYDSAIAKMGSGNRVPYDENFVFLTLPTTRTGKAKIDPVRGVKINYLYYWNEAFQDPVVQGTRVHVRYDPFDAAVAYAFVNKSWVKLICQQAANFQGRSEKEIQYAAAELRRMKKVNSRLGSTVDALRIGAFITEMESDENRMAERQRQAQIRDVHKIMDGIPLSDPVPQAESGQKVIPDSVAIDGNDNAIELDPMDEYF